MTENQPPTRRGRPPAKPDQKDSDTPSREELHKDEQENTAEKTSSPQRGKWGVQWFTGGELTRDEFR